MKRIVSMMMALSMIAVMTVACGGDGDDEGTGKPVAAPSIVLEGADIDQPQEIVSPMTVKVAVAAPAGIKRFVVSIDSPALTSEMMATVGLSTTFDLADPGKMAEALGALGFPTGDNVVGKTALSFDLSTLVPMIAQIYQETSDHKFVLEVTDAKGQMTKKTLTCHLTAKAALVYNNDADLWKNTASVTAKHLPEGATVQYRVKDAAEWVAATAGEGGLHTLAPVWSAAKNAAGLDIHKVEDGTGIFAATAYEVRVEKGGETLATAEFTTEAGNSIPNGDMSAWSRKEMNMFGTIYKITTPNAAGETFWDSGNNGFVEQYDENDKLKVDMPLCREDRLEKGTACLSAQMVLGSIFAAGNMFTGVFTYEGFSGTASFGQPYPWKARPRALKLRYKATVGTVDKKGANDPEADKYMGKQDNSSIFMAVVDWKERHGVTSGMSAPTGMWNPAEAASFNEGPVLGYGIQQIAESTKDWVELTIPVVWYDKEAAAPAEQAFSLVISCTTSVRGDYLTGCSTNKMQVDDFAWVY